MVHHMECLQSDHPVFCDCCVKFVLTLLKGVNQTWGRGYAVCSSSHEEAFPPNNYPFPINFYNLSILLLALLSVDSKYLIRKHTWATFPKQDEAMNFMKEQGDLRIFSYQDHFNGQRRFLVSSYNEFWKRLPIMEENFSSSDLSCLYVSWPPNHFLKYSPCILIQVQEYESEFPTSLWGDSRGNHHSFIFWFKTTNL